MKTSLLEGSPPEFNCMNEHYGLSFERGQDGESYASGTLRAEKVHRIRQQHWLSFLSLCCTSHA